MPKHHLTKEPTSTLIIKKATRLLYNQDRRDHKDSTVKVWLPYGSMYHS